MVFVCRAGEEDSSHSAAELLRRAGGVARTATFSRRGCASTGWHRISTILPGNFLTYSFAASLIFFSQKDAVSVYFVDEILLAPRKEDLILLLPSEHWFLAKSVKSQSLFSAPVAETPLYWKDSATPPRPQCWFIEVDLPISSAWWRTLLEWQTSLTVH